MNSGADHTANYQALAIITRLLMAGIFLITALLGIISFMIPGTFLVSCSGGNGFNRNGLEISFSIENRTHYKTRNVLKF